MHLKANQVVVATTPSADYGECSRGDWPELPRDVRATSALAGLRRMLLDARFDAAHAGTASWNPLGDLIQEGDRVVLKPNWVAHENQSGAGMDCLVTHTRVLEAILHYAVKARPAQIVVGDAPVQTCDFEALRQSCELDRLTQQFSRGNLRVVVKDFRRTIRTGLQPESAMRSDCRPLEEFVLFDLRGSSILEPISDDSGQFRVTMYDPSLMKRTHTAGRHQYLIAKDVIEADVVINVPKLKTHKKAGVTGALKNLVGINGNKEYLPHHRKGGAVRGGDCYQGGSTIKHLVEEFLDRANSAQGGLYRRTMFTAARAGAVVARMFGEDGNYEGSWHGNDTVWRMCLDLQRILHFGRPDGTLQDTPKRIVLSITDAIIAGEGDGPIAPTPVAFGRMSMGLNTAAVEWVNTLLMGLNPERIPLTEGAFEIKEFPLVEFQPESIAVVADGERMPLESLFDRLGRSFRPPDGWRGHIERTAAVSGRMPGGSSSSGAI